MSPNFYLLLLILAALVGVLISGSVSVVRGRALRAEAARLGLQYSHPDRFLLARRVARQLPVPGASEVSVRDVAYAKVEGGIACVMTARFTIGTTGRRRNLRRVVAALDPGGEDLLRFQMVEGKVDAGAYAAAHAGLVGEGK